MSTSISSAKRNNPMRVALNAARGIEETAEPEDAPEDVPAAPVPQPPTEAEADPVTLPSAAPEALNGHDAAPLPAAVTMVRMGRPPGKRSDPNYMQMTAYIPIDIHEDIKEELLRVNRDRRRQKQPALEISDLVETQLGAWLRGQRAEKANG